METSRNNGEKTVADLPIWDELAALSAAGGNANLAHELIQALTRELPQELEELRNCFQQSDWPTLRKTAHRVRGAARCCGASALGTCLELLERSAETGDRDHIETELVRVEREAERLARIVGN